MTKDEFIQALNLLGMNSVHFSEFTGTSESTVRSWRRRSGPNPPNIAAKVIEMEMERRGLEWPIKIPK
jgi:DNA-binding transcriptional regulator YiaG